jgi:hypothetical protein
MGLSGARVSPCTIEEGAMCYGGCQCEKCTGEPLDHREKCMEHSLKYPQSGAYYAQSVVMLLRENRIKAVSKTFVPAAARMQNRDGIRTTQTVTYTKRFPGCMVSDILMNYADGRILDNGDREYTVYDNMKWTIHLIKPD